MVTTSAQQILKNAHMSGSPEVPDRFWELLERYRAELVIQAQAILRNREDAEEVVQETFCEALRNLEQLAQVQSLAAWLKSVNRGNALDRLRNSSREKDRAERKGSGKDEAFTTGGFSRLELRDSLDKALARLPPRLSQAVRWHYFDNLSYKQIAERLNMPVGSVSAMMLDATVALFADLRESLQPENPQAPESETQSNPPVPPVDGDGGKKS